MGEAFQNLKARGKSVVVERQENIVIERSEHNLIKRKQTVVREKFINELPSPRKQENRKSKNSNHRSTRKSTDTKAKQKSEVSPRTCSSPDQSITAKPFSALELAALKQDIDNEIKKLKQRRQHILNDTDTTAKENDKMRKKNSASIQNDKTWDQNFNSNKANNVEYTFEKYSSEHKMPCYKRDEQTSCRPRMRTIGMQKDTHRGASHLNTNNSCSNLKYISTCEAIPTAFACFEYGPNCAVSDYYNNAHNTCRKYCQRYNATGNYNGVLCNQNTYRESGRTPCSEYNYCRDEYYYDYSNTPHAQHHYQQQPAMATCQPCRCHGDCQHNSRRRRSDLNTNEYFERKKERRQSGDFEDRVTTKKYMVAISKRQAEQDREEAKARRAGRSKRDSLTGHVSRSTAKDRDGKLRSDKWRGYSSARIADLISRGKRDRKKQANPDSDDTDSETIRIKKEKMKITKKKSYRMRRAHDKDQADRRSFFDGDYDHICDASSDEQLPEVCETKRTLEKMRITAYKPTRSHKRDSQLKDDDKKESARTSKVKDEGNKQESAGKSKERYEGSKKDSARTSKEKEEGSKEVKKEKQYEEYISQYKQEPQGDRERLSAKPEAEKNISSNGAIQYGTEMTEGKPDDMLNSARSPTVESRPGPYGYSGKLPMDSNNIASTHDGKETLESRKFAELALLSPNKGFDDQTESSKIDQRQYERMYPESGTTTSEGTTRANLNRRISKDDNNTTPRTSLLSPAGIARAFKNSKDIEENTLRNYVDITERPMNQSELAQLLKRERLEREKEYAQSSQLRTIPEQFSTSHQSNRDVIKEETPARDSKFSRNLEEQLSPLEILAKEEAIPKGSEDRNIYAELSARERTNRANSLKQGSPDRITRGSPLLMGSRERTRQEILSPRERSTRTSALSKGSGEQSLKDQQSPRGRLARENSLQDRRERIIEEQLSSRYRITDTPQERKAEIIQDISSNSRLIIEPHFERGIQEKTVEEELSLRGRITTVDPIPEGSLEITVEQELSVRDRIIREEALPRYSLEQYKHEQSALQDEMLEQEDYPVVSHDKSFRERIPPSHDTTAEKDMRQRSREQTIPASISPRERMIRAKAYRDGSRERTKQEQIPPRQQFGREEELSITSRERALQEQLSPRGRLTKTNGSPKESQERTIQNQQQSPRESLAMKGNYRQDSRERSLKNQLSTHYQQDSRDRTVQSQKTPRDSFARKDDYSPSRQERHDGERLSLRDQWAKEEASKPDSQERTIQNGQEQRGSFVRRESYLQDRLSPRGRLAREEAFPLEGLEETVQSQQTPRDSLTMRSNEVTIQNRQSPRESYARRESYRPGSRERSLLEQLSPLEETSVPDRQEQFLPPQLSPRDRLTKEEAYTEGNLGRSEQHSPRRSLANETYLENSRERAFQELSMNDRLSNVKPEREEQNLQGQLSPRERLSAEYTQGRLERTVQKQQSPRGSITKKDYNGRNDREQSLKDELSPRRVLADEDSFPISSGEQNIQNIQSLRGSLAYRQDSLEHALQLQLSPRELLARQEAFPQESRERALQEQLSPRELLTRQEAFPQGSRERALQEQLSLRDSSPKEDFPARSPERPLELFQHDLWEREEVYIPGSLDEIIPGQNAPRQSLIRKDITDSQNRNIQNQQLPRDIISTERTVPKLQSPRESLARNETYPQDNKEQDNYRPSPVELIAQEETGSDSRERMQAIVDRLSRNDAIRSGNRVYAEPEQLSPHEHISRELLSRRNEQMYLPQAQNETLGIIVRDADIHSGSMLNSVLPSRRDISPTAGSMHQNGRDSIKRPSTNQLEPRSSPVERIVGEEILRRMSRGPYNEARAPFPIARTSFECGSDYVPQPRTSSISQYPRSFMQGDGYGQPASTAPHHQSILQHYQEHTMYGNQEMDSGVTDADLCRGITTDTATPQTSLSDYVSAPQSQTEEEILQRRDLESRLRYCEELHEASRVYCVDNEFKCAELQRTDNQHYSDDECKYDKEVKERLKVHKNATNAIQNDVESESKVASSAYVTASSCPSYTCSSTNEDTETYLPTRHYASYQNQQIPAYTGCPCMLSTYLDLVDIVSSSSSVVKKTRDVCEKRIKFK